MKNNIQKQEKRRFLLLNSFRLAILLFALGFTFPCFAGETVTYTLKKEAFIVQIDCNGIDHAGTSDNITVSFYNGSTLLRTTDKNVGGGAGTFGIFHPDNWVFQDTPQCNSVEDAIYAYNLDVDKYRRDGNNNHDLYQNEGATVTHVVVETNGSDAFWMDEVRLRRVKKIEKRTTDDSSGASIVKDETDEELLQHWGRDGGQGYCLSTDPNDASGSWEDYVQLCTKSLTFRTSSADDVFVTNPETTPRTAPKRPSDIVGMAIAGSNDHVYVWYNDGTVSSGTSSDLDAHRGLYNYSLPNGKRPSDIAGMAIAGSTDHVYVWYNDGTVSSGTSSDLDAHRGLYNYSLPNGKRPSDIAGMAIAGSTDHVYVWYNDGTVSSGRSDDLDVYRGLYNYSLPNGKRPSDIAGMAIAGSTDHVYVWYNDGTVSSGRSNDLDVYRGLYQYQ